MTAFRPARRKDARKLAVLRKLAWESAYRGIYPDELLDQYDFSQHTKRFQQQIATAGVQVFLISHEGNDVGYVTVSQRRGYKDFEFCMDSLYLVPEAQGQGVGRCTMEFVRRQCRKMGYLRFYNSCNPHNRRACDFYAAMGGQVGDRDDHNSDPAWDQWYYEYRLE